MLEVKTLYRMTILGVLLCVIGIIYSCCSIYTYYYADTVLVSTRKLTPLMYIKGDDTTYIYHIKK